MPIELKGDALTVFKMPDSCRRRIGRRLGLDRVGWPGTDPAAFGRPVPERMLRCIDRQPPDEERWTLRRTSPIPAVRAKR